MFNISVNINATNNRGERITGMTISYKDFLTLKNILSSIDMSIGDVDLSKIEQGALINELLKRPGVRNRVVKSCDCYVVRVGSEFVKDIDGKGPANIIIVK